jgi:hypothetical protein
MPLSFTQTGTIKEEGQIREQLRDPGSAAVVE